MAKKSLTLPLLLALLASLLLVASPAQAGGRITPSVAVRASATTVEVGEWVKLTGAVSGPSRFAPLRLQERIEGRWVSVDEARVRRNRTYAFRIPVYEPVTQYRVKVLRTSKLRPALSRPITLYGAEVPDPVEPDPEDPTDPPVDPEDPTDPPVDPEDPTDPPTDPEYPTDPPTDPQDPTLPEQDLAQLRYDLNVLINARRADAGLDPLNMEVSLNQYAQTWSEAQDQADAVSQRDSFADAPASFVVQDEFVTMNSMPASVVDFLEYQSPEMLYGDYRWIGIGMSPYNDEIGYWTLDFAVDKPTEPPAPEWTEEEVRQLILRDTNAFRAQHGLAPLQLMPQLNSVAQSWSRHMADTNTFQHNPSFAQQYPSGWRAAGENIAAGYDPTAVVQGWINSPGHRANLLGDYNYIGIGFAENANSTYKRYYTQNFARY